jgi:outer membrane immunogenic protein
MMVRNDGVNTGNRVIALFGLAVLGAACCFATVAASADLKPVRRSAEPWLDAPSQVYNWTGFYAGGYLGGAHGVWTLDFFRNNNHGHAEPSVDGVAAGILGGYNYQFARNWVIGAEADLGFASGRQTNEVFDNDHIEFKYGMTGSLRGRLGYAIDRLLFFGTAGLGFANITNNLQKGRNAGEQIVWENQFRTGWTVGGGAEYAFTNRIVGRVEYLYNNFGTVTVFNADQNRAVMKNELHILRAAASYRF